MVTTDHLRTLRQVFRPPLMALAAALFYFCSGGPAAAQTDQAGDPPTATSETAEGAPEENRDDQAKTDLSGLPDDLRTQLETYLDRQDEIFTEVKRFEALAGAQNPWARRRAAAMGARITHDLRQQRAARREIMRTYRQHLTSGWNPPENFSLEAVLLPPGAEQD